MDGASERAYIEITVDFPPLLDYERSWAIESILTVTDQGGCRGCTPACWLAGGTLPGLVSEEAVLTVFVNDRNEAPTFRTSIDIMADIIMGDIERTAVWGSAVGTPLGEPLVGSAEANAARRNGIEQPRPPPRSSHPPSMHQS